MGSILSFPILCLVSFLGYAMSVTDIRKSILKKQKKLSRRKYITDISSVGVNGDDIVFKAKDLGQEWSKRIAVIGGKVSRGKTIVSPTCFTINSELWYKEEQWKKPGAVRPTLLLGIADGRYASPEKLWIEYKNSPIAHLESFFDIGSRLKIHLPPSMGGIGIEKKFCLRSVIEYCELKKIEKKNPIVIPISRKEPWMDVKEPSVYITINRSEQKIVRSVIDEIWKGVPRWEKKEKKENFTIDFDRQVLFCTKEERDEYERFYNEKWRLYEKGLVQVKYPKTLLASLDDVTVFGVNYKVSKKKSIIYKGSQPNQSLSVDPHCDPVAPRPQIRTQSDARLTLALHRRSPRFIRYTPQAYHWVYKNGSWNSEFSIIRELTVLPVELRVLINEFVIL